MATQWSRRITRVVVALLLGALAGCAPPVINSNPDTFNVPADAAKYLHAGGPVALKNAYPSETKVKIWTNGDMNWFGDLKQYTDTVMTMMSREMAKKSVVVQTGAPKTVTLKVYDVGATPGFWVIPSHVTLEAAYGDGTKSTIMAENSSPSDAWRSVDGSLMFAVTRLLGDEKFIAYVNK